MALGLLVAVPLTVCPEGGPRNAILLDGLVLLLRRLVGRYLVCYLLRKLLILLGRL